MKELNGFEIEKYNVYGFNKDQKTSTCPKCSEQRKKNKDKCLSLFWDTGLGKCNHCGELIQLHTYKSNQKEVVYEVPEFKYSELDDKVIKWFEGRGISQKTLSHAKITQSVEWMPQTQKEENTINFNYFVNDEIVNIKYRDGRKNFKLYKGAEKVFYNLDSIRTSKECVIVEGEIDALTFIEQGYYNVVSVPNGFNLKGNINLDYLNNYLEWFDNKEKIYLCFDNDEAGQKGKLEFVRRLGSERCYIVDLEGSKDANEYNGNLIERLEKAELTPVDNIVTLNNFWDEIDDFWLNGLPKGMTIDIEEFDEIFSCELEQYTLITGVPQSGKSEFLDLLTVKYNLKYGEKIGYASLENEPFKLHYDKIFQKIYGKSPSKEEVGTEKVNEVKKHIAQSFYHVSIKGRYYLEDVLDKFRELRKRFGIRIFAIDPFNKVRLKTKIQNLNDYTSEYHILLDEFVKETGSHLFLVAHPTKTQKAEGAEDSYAMPNAYDIKGGGEHFDMSYNVLGVNRIYEQKIVHVKVLKMKFKHLGEQMKSVFFSYNTINGRYEELEYQPKHLDFETIINARNLDYSNWLTKEEPKQMEVNIDFDSEVDEMYNEKEVPF